MDQSPSREADIHSGDQEFSHNVWNPKVHYDAHKSLPGLCPKPDESSWHPPIIIP
jgi:hypothetical protein